MEPAHELAIETEYAWESLSRAQPVTVVKHWEGPAPPVDPASDSVDHNAPVDQQPVDQQPVDQQPAPVLGIFMKVYRYSPLSALTVGSLSSKPQNLFFCLIQLIISIIFGISLGAEVANWSFGSYLPRWSTFPLGGGLAIIVALHIVRVRTSFFANLVRVHINFRTKRFTSTTSLYVSRR
jgi:hypothetical protein